MNVDQCKALGLHPYAVYGGKVESFKVREHAVEAYGDPVILQAFDRILPLVEAAVAWYRGSSLSLAKADDLSAAVKAFLVASGAEGDASA